MAATPHLLEQAAEAVERQTGIELVPALIDGGRPEGEVGLLRIGPEADQVPVLARRWAAQSGEEVLVNRVRQVGPEAMLAADYINPRMAERLRAEGIQFIDTAGNAYLNRPPVFVYVTANKPPKTIAATQGVQARRAFSTKGLMVVFGFLLDPELVNAPYRTIAERTGVAMGTVGPVLKQLQEAGYVSEGRSGGSRLRQLTRCSKLLERWVDLYPENLRRKHYLGTYAAAEPEWWKTVDVRSYEARWGGEVAGYYYTGFLQPEIATVYLPGDNKADFIRDHRLRKATGGEPYRIDLYQRFWPSGLDAGLPYPEELVHPVLAYADLMASGDARNQEVARQIHDQSIDRYCGED